MSGQRGWYLTRGNRVFPFLNSKLYPSGNKDWSSSAQPMSRLNLFRMRKFFSAPLLSKLKWKSSFSGHGDMRFTINLITSNRS